MSVKYLISLLPQVVCGTKGQTGSRVQFCFVVFFFATVWFVRELFALCFIIEKKNVRIEVMHLR